MKYFYKRLHLNATKIIAVLLIGCTSNVLAHGNPHWCGYEYAEALREIRKDHGSKELDIIKASRVVTMNGKFLICPDGSERNAKRTRCLVKGTWSNESVSATNSAKLYSTFKMLRGCEEFLGVKINIGL
jgi:hypothetical protein